MEESNMRANIVPLTLKRWEKWIHSMRIAESAVAPPGDRPHYWTEPNTVTTVGACVMLWFWHAIYGKDKP